MLRFVNLNGRSHRWYLFERVRSKRELNALKFIFITYCLMSVVGRFSILLPPHGHGTHICIWESLPFQIPTLCTLPSTPTPQPTINVCPSVQIYSTEKFSVQSSFPPVQPVPFYPGTTFTATSNRHKKFFGK